MKRINVTKKDIVYLVVILLLAVGFVLSLTLGGRENGNAMQEYYNNKCQTFEMENANFSRGQIVFIGDSITDGCALDDYYGGLNLATYNRGIGGDTTAGVLKRLQSSVLDLQPSKIVLMIGINDINGGLAQNKLLKNYDEILKKISENLPNTQVICVSILPLNRDLSGYTTIDVDKSMGIIKQVNPEIQRLTEKYGYAFLDVFAEFLDADNYLYKNLSPDGIHLNADGYRKYSAKLMPLLQESA